MPTVPIAVTASATRMPGLMTTGSAIGRRPHEHRVGDPHVVVEAEHGIEHRQRGQRVVPGLDQARKMKYLP